MKVDGIDMEITVESIETQLPYYFFDNAIVYCIGRV